MRSIEETRAEIERRNRLRQSVKASRIRTGLGLVATLLVFVLTRILATIPADPSPVNEGYYGSLMLSAEAGRFILFGCICFLLGIIITILFYKKR
ncbi:MAG: hypothetical protein K6G69_06495 [Lachnospiraceae bacterium]|nr:hypothetical protein [Lachnospiraceae bacterium]